MRKLLIGVLLAAALSSSTAGTASADPGDVISVAPGGGVTLSGSLTVSAPPMTTTCTWSITGSVSAGPIVQTSALTPIGGWTAAKIVGCTSGTLAATMSATAVWREFIILPLPGGGAMHLRFQDIRIAITIVGVTCEYGGTLGSSGGDIVMSAPSGGANTLTLTSATAPRVGGSALLCGAIATISGSLRQTAGQTVTLR